MPTFAESAEARDALWSVIWTIEGLGNYSGLYKFCTQVPNYAAADSLYRPWAMEWPKIMEEEADYLGGVPESGEVTVQMLDFDDILTSEWRTEADPVTFLNGDWTSSSTSFAPLLATPFTAGSSIAWLGNECIRITAGTGPFTVTRAWLDTDPFAHFDGDPIFAYTPYLHQRRVKVFIAPLDGNSADDEAEFGVYSADRLALTEQLGGWILAARSHAKWMTRTVCRRPRKRYRAQSVRANEIEIIEIEPGPSPVSWDPASLDHHVKIGDEIAAGVITSWGVLRLDDRALLGTAQQDIEPGMEVEIIYAADQYPTPSGHLPTWFRWSPGPSPATSRTSGTIYASSHWIDLTFNLAMSSADEADGLELNNRNSDFGAWDFLPVGIGIGVPHDLIDIEAGLEVRARFPDQRFPDFWVGPEQIPFGKLITDHFLRPLGGYISTGDGRAKIVMPRTPLAGTSTISIGPEDILQRPVGRRLYQADLGAKLDTKRNTQTIIAKFKDRAIVVHAANFGRSAKDQRGYYATEEKPIEIPVPSARTDRNGMVEFISEAFRHRFIRFRQPRWEIDIRADISKYATHVGELIDVTYPDLVDMATGARGWEAMVCELARRLVTVGPRTGATTQWGAIAYSSNIRVGAIAPSARIVSVANAGTTPDVTISDNRYTHADAQGFPTTDSDALTVGDVVRLRNRNGTSAASGVQTITAINSGVPRLDGNFSGTLTNGTGNAGLILEYAPRATAAAQQYNRFVYLADQTNLTVGASTQTPWKFQ